MMLGSHCRAGSDKTDFTLALALVQTSGLGVDLLSGVPRGVWLCKVSKVGTDRTRSRRRLERCPSLGEVEIRAGAEDENSPSSLGNSNLLTLDALIGHIIPHGRKVRHNLSNGLSRHGQQAVDVLRNEHLGLDSTNHFDKGLIERASSRVEAFALSSMAEVLTWESPCDDIRSREGEVFLQKRSNILQVIVVGPSIQFCELLGLGKDIVLEDNLKRKPFQTHEARRSLVLLDPLMRHTVPMDNDVL
jgi:hypothetical protein